MINILIVDDERHVVNYISSLLQSRQDLELEIYQAYSGAEAIEYAQQIKFNLILLDINMPGLSGLEVAKEIGSMWPQTRILFLTAYDNFDYIYQAVSINCCGYLLKIEPDQVIINRICEIVGEIKNDLFNTQQMNEAQRKAMIFSILLHQNILKGICSGWEAERVKAELINMPAENPIQTDKPFYLMYACCPRLAPDENKDSYIDSALSYIQLMQQLLCGKFTCHLMNCGHGAIMYFFQSVDSRLKTADLIFLKNISDDFVYTLYAKNQTKLMAVLYGEAVEFKSISKIFYQLEHHCDSLLSADEPYVTSVNSDELPVSTTDLGNTENPSKLIERLSGDIYAGDAAQFFKALSVLKAQCIALKSMHHLSAVKIYLSISLVLIKYIEQNKLQETLAMEGAIYPLYSIDFPNWEQAFDYLLEISHNIFKLINSKKANRSEHIITVIKNYVNENLCSNLTLSKASELVNYNESYISRLFKSSSGEGFSEYVNHVRLDKAKELLITTNLAIQEIAEAVGFDASQYFSNVFKKYVGASPTDYRIYNTVA